MPGPIPAHIFKKNTANQTPEKNSHIAKAHTCAHPLKNQQKIAKKRTSQGCVFLAIYFWLPERNPTNVQKKNPIPRLSARKESARTAVFFIKKMHPKAQSRRSICANWLACAFAVLGGIDLHHSTPHCEQQQCRPLFFIFFIFIGRDRLAPRHTPP